MKNLFAFMFLCFIAAIAYGQHATSRQTVFGVTDASVTSYFWSPITDLASATVDTIEIRPRAAFSRYQVTVVDSFTLRLKSTAGMYYGDVVTLDIINPTITNNFVYLKGNWIVSTGTAKIALTSGKSSFLQWWFDGTNLVEGSRNLNYTR